MQNTVNYQFIVPLTERQKNMYDSKRKREGKTSQGCMRSLVLAYIGEVEHDEHSDS